MWLMSRFLEMGWEATIHLRGGEISKSKNDLKKQVKISGVSHDS